MPAGRACTSSGGWLSSVRVAERGEDTAALFRARGWRSAGASGLDQDALSLWRDGFWTPAALLLNKPSPNESWRKLICCSRPSVCTPRIRRCLLRQVKDALARAERQTLRRASRRAVLPDTQVAANQNKRDPSQSLLLARSAIRATWPVDGYVASSAARATLDCSGASRARPGAPTLSLEDTKRPWVPDRRPTAWTGRTSSPLVTTRLPGCGTPRAARNCYNWAVTRARSGRWP